MPRRPLIGLLALFVIFSGVIVWLLQSHDPGLVAIPDDEIATASSPPVNPPDMAAIDAPIATEVFGTPTASAGPPESYARALCGFRGRILDVDGTPEAGIRVELLGGNLVQLLPAQEAWFGEELPDLHFIADDTRTDAAGRFEFVGVDPHGYYLLAIDHQGPRSTFRIVDVTPQPGELVDLGDITLDPYAVLLGRVIDEDDHPVAAARVRASALPTIAYTYGLGRVRRGCSIAVRLPAVDTWQAFELPSIALSILDRLPVPETRTATDGTFRLEGVPLGTATVLVDKEGLVSAVRGPIPTRKGGEQTLSDLRLRSGDDLIVRVVDAADQPVAGAEVKVGALFPLFPASLQEPIGHTDANGLAVARAISDEEHIVSVRGPEATQWLFAEEAYAGDEVVIRLKDSAQLTVLVKDAADRVIARPTLVLRGDNEFTRELEGGLSMGFLVAPPLGLTGRIHHQDDGAVLITGLSAGEFTVYAKAAGFAIATAAADLRSGSASIEMRLVAEQRGSVRVVRAADGQPVEYALVSVYEGDSEDFNMSPLLLRHAGPDGVAMLPGLEPGAHSVRVFHPAYAVESAALAVPGPEVVVALSAGGSLAGRVLRGGEVPDESRTIVAAPDGDEQEGLPRLGMTDATGKFLITHLKPGTYHVIVMPRLAELGSSGGASGMHFNISDLFMARASEAEAEGDVRMDAGSPGGPEAERSAVVSQGQETWLDIDLLRMEGDGERARLLGVVLIDGRPTSHLRVTAGSRQGFSSPRPADTDASGRFDLGDVPAGELVLRVIDTAEELLLHRELLTLTPDETREVTVRIETGRLSGKVVSARDGQPIPYAEIALAPFRDKDAPAFFLGADRAGATDEAGRFAFDMIPVGSYTVMARAPGFAEASQGPVDVAARGTATVTLTLPTSVSVDGTVEMPGGVTAPMIFVVFQGKGFRLATADRDTHRFEVTDLAPGDYEVHIGGSDVDLAPIHLQVPAQGLHGVTLRPQPAPPEPTPAPPEPSDTGEK